MIPDECFTYEDAQTALFKFEELLRRWSILIKPRSALEAAALSVMDLVDLRQRPDSTSWLVDLGGDAANLVGLNDLAVHIIRVADHPDFKEVVPHLRLLNEGEPLQNRASQSRDHAANKLFELLVACWAMRAGANDVRLDNPHRSKGDNPDVMFRWRDDTWGVACKALHSRVPQTIFDKMRDGIRQIEACRADCGIVLLNAKNVIRHTEYLRLANHDKSGKREEPLYQSLPRSEPQRMLMSEVDALLAGVRDGIDPQEMIDSFLGTKTMPAWIIWAHTTSVVDLEGRPMLTSVPRLTVGQLSQQPNSPLSLRPADLELLEQFNEAANISPRPKA